MEVYVSPEKLRDVRDKIAEAGYEIVKTELIMEPKNYAEVNEDKRDKVLKFLDILEEHDDVQRVFTNF